MPDYMIRAGRTYYFARDHLGSVRYVIDVDDQSIAQVLRYDECGQVAFDSNPGFQPFGFAGGLYDEETGLTRFGVRDYEARTGRWTARDPIGFGGGQANLYVYVNNGPISSIDPTGLAVFTALLVGALIGAAVGYLSYRASTPKECQTAQGALGWALGGAIGGAIFAGGTAIVSAGLLASSSGTVVAGGLLDTFIVGSTFGIPIGATASMTSYSISVGIDPVRDVSATGLVTAGVSGGVFGALGLGFGYQAAAISRLFSAGAARSAFGVGTSSISAGGRAAGSQAIFGGSPVSGRCGCAR